jgi:hypothetical protein
LLALMNNFYANITQNDNLISCHGCCVTIRKGTHFLF